MANPLDSFKNLPAWGKGAVIVGGAGAVFWAYRMKKNKSSASSSTTASTSDTSGTTDPVTGLPYSEDNQVDSATGLTYLSEAQQYGSVQAAESALSGSYQGGANYGYGGNNSGGYPTYYPTNPPQAGTAYATNAAWAQAVEAGLTDIGYSSTDVAAALGRFLANLSVTPAQASIINAGLAEYGPPPSGSFTVHLAPTPPPSAKVEVPNVVNDRLANAESALSSAGFKVHAPAMRSGYEGIVTSQSPHAGASEEKGSTVNLTVRFEKAGKR